MDKLKSKIWLKLAGMVSLMVAICISAANYFYGFDYADAFYHGCNFLYSGKTDIFLPLTQACYKLTYNLFGDYTIGYRLVNWFIYLLGFLLSFVLLCGKDAKDKPLMVLLLSASVVFMPLTNTTSFCGNSLTSLFALLIFVAIIKLSEGKQYWYFLLAIFLILAPLSRFPNIVFYPAVLAMGMLMLPRRDYLKLIASLSVSILLYLVVNMILFGGINGFFSAIVDRWNNENSSTAANHSISSLIVVYIAWLKDIMSYVKVIGFITIIPLAFSLFKSKWLRYAGVAAYAICQLGFVVMRLRGAVDESHFVLVFLYANIFVVTFALSLRSLIKHNWKEFFLYVASFLFTICATAGSDWAFQLWGGAIFGLIPWLAMNTIKAVRDDSSTERLLVICGVVLFFVSAFFYVRNGMTPIGLMLMSVTLIAACFADRVKLGSKLLSCQQTHTPAMVGYVAALLVVGVGVAIHKQSKLTFASFPMKDMNSSFNVPMNKWMRTSSDSQAFVDEVLRNYDNDIQNNKVIFFGFASNFFGYYTHVGMIEGVDFTCESSERNMSLVEQALVDRPIMYLIPEAPDTSLWSTLEDYTVLDSIMDAHHYKKVVDDRFKYARYYPMQEVSDEQQSLPISE
ncbi:MAG: hypothetical protein MJZ67_05415 [Bacteroidales bacterium]|nr:hypothetical protein [Bacteroidales bacterium]